MIEEGGGTDTVRLSDNEKGKVNKRKRHKTFPKTSTKNIFLCIL